MELAREWITYESPAGPVSAYLAWPAAVTDPLPAVVVMQEVWGVDGHIADVTERVASAGYVALAPDLYSAGGGRAAALAPERVEAVKSFLDAIPSDQWTAVLGDEQRRAQALARLPEGEGVQVGETLGTLFGGMRDMGRYLAIVHAAIAFARSHPACRGREVATIGFCLGGSLSALLACEQPPPAAAVIFYGGSPTAEQVASIGCPVRGFYGQDDPRIVGGLRDFEAALRDAGADFELHVYPDTPHAFFNDTRPSYRVEAARDAWGRTLAFLAQQLAPLTTVPAGQAAEDAAGG
ncbi:MAG TPA: dienelactone hydrolase family protein [Solirubrobacteraceae bacterium]|nr:dienelactone hydrolase family protein [Solirubrobacteraceae bacterium]